METVDGICQNGLMEKAIIKEREIQVQRDANMCKSNQDIYLLIDNIDSKQGWSVNSEYDSRSLNDRCKKIKAGYFSCTLSQEFKYALKYLVGGTTTSISMEANLVK